MVCCSSLTKIFNKLVPELGLSNKSSCLVAALGVTKFKTVIVMNLITIVA
jgi:hypothetical protein